MSKELDEWCFLYTYDDRNRLVEKRVPKQQPTYYGYDNLNRLVLTQDGNMRLSNKWMFVKYDGLGRTVMQGYYTNTTYTTRSSVQANVLDALYSSGAYYENRGTALHGYTNQSFPTANSDSSPLAVQVVNYYDDYDFDFNGLDDYSYSAQSLTGEGTPSVSFGMPTGSKRRILGTGTWLYSYVFYDKFGRAIQMKSNNHLSATVDNITTIVYDFQGKTLTTKKYHNAGGSNQTTVINKYEYDHSGRLKKVYQNNNNAGSDQLVAQYAYNELGQLIDKKLHDTGLGNFLQSVDYRYHIRGWLSSINNSQLTNDGTLNDDTGDYFGLELSYEKAGGMSNTAVYNGNLSAMKWKTIGEAAGTAGQRSYKYTYDKSDKLKAATFQAYGTSAWNKETNTLDEAMTYDHNGNILKLTRKQNERGLSGTTVTSSAQTLDDLSYTYASGAGNRLTKVEDDGLTSEGFSDGSSATTEYKYDTLGNMTVDKNKGIDSLKYNDLGKVSRIKFTDGRAINYTYDATGAKLTVKNYNSSGTLIKTTDYLESFVYEDGALQFFGSPEGRVVKNASDLEYQYAIADHQGNTRIVFSSVTPDPITKTATFEPSGGDDNEFLNVDNIVTFNSANHTTSGSKVIRMNQSYAAGPSKSLKVYPGDKIDLDVYAYYENGSGYGTSNKSAGAMITAIAGAFGGVTGAGGESGTIFDGVNSALGGFGLGSNAGDEVPSAFLNYILFDQNYKVVTMGWTAVSSAANFSKEHLEILNIKVKEAGYLFTYLSYESQSNNYVYFDDMRVIYTPGNLIQANEYYPFGMQTVNSWTRENMLGNNYLGNGGTEVNPVSKLYDLDYRNYDAVLGVLRQVDPMVDKYAALSPYSFAANDPANLNDPSGADYDDHNNDDYNVMTGHSRRVDMMWNWLQVINGGGGGGLSVINMSAWGRIVSDTFGYLTGRIDENDWKSNYAKEIMWYLVYSEVKSADNKVSTVMSIYFDKSFHDDFSNQWYASYGQGNYAAKFQGNPDRVNNYKDLVSLIALNFQNEYQTNKSYAIQIDYDYTEVPYNAGAMTNMYDNKNIVTYIKPVLLSLPQDLEVSLAHEFFHARDYDNGYSNRLYQIRRSQGWTYETMRAISETRTYLYSIKYAESKGYKEIVKIHTDYMNSYKYLLPSNYEKFLY